MSRRKQPNPNKVKQMEGALEDKRLADGSISAALHVEPELSALQEDDQPQDEHPEKGRVEEDTEDIGDRENRVELSSIKSIMSTVMNIKQLNGSEESPVVTPTKTLSKSPAGNRTGRRNQETKEDRSNFICPLCDKNCLTQHQLTMHIRQHNSDSGNADHSCSICGKSLSSASSLDRHMLVHSGERPYKCSVCGQTFTTNGNMHRHMKIHDKDPNTPLASSPPSPTKRRRPSAKRKPSVEDEDEHANEPPSKKVSEEGFTEEMDVTKSKEEQLPCPVCSKTFLCKNSLESHLETHGDVTLKCDRCCIAFRTHRGLLNHNAAVHKQLPKDADGHPFIQNNPSILAGFNDLSFIDFSCSKFPNIAQVWCETNLRRCSSKFHRFVCDMCNKGFPLQPALDLHLASHKNGVDSAEEVKPSLSQDSASTEEQSNFMESLGLQHISKVKPVPTEDDIQQTALDSIKVIHVEKSTSSLPQEISTIGLPVLYPASLQGLPQVSALGFLSLQPFQNNLFIQADTSVVVKPIVGETGEELADIPQILQMTSSAPNLPPLMKAPSNQVQANCKPMPTLKPKPLVTPRSSKVTSTPPPLMSAQQASPGCISPNLPPPANQLLGTPGGSSSSSCSQGSVQERLVETDLVVDSLTSVEPDQKPLQEGLEENVDGGKKAYCNTTTSPYQCNICRYPAPDNATLIRHRRTHSGERPYVCRICHYPFTVKANCERHLRKKHAIDTREEIEKSIEYVDVATTDHLDSSCHNCGEDLKNYRALQIHLRSQNGCQRKPFECRQCGAAFLAKRNCIHHLLKQHPEIQERRIEENISTVLPTANRDATPAQNGTLCPSIKTEDIKSYPDDLDQPLDFSNKGMGTTGTMGSPYGIKHEGFHSLDVSPYDSIEPIDLSIRKNSQKKLKRDPLALSPASPTFETKKERSSPNAIQAQPLEEKPQPLTSYQVPFTNGTLSCSRPLRLKPLLPKPASAKDLPPLASIAKIISSVSAAPALLKTEGAPNGNCTGHEEEKCASLKQLYTDAKLTSKLQPKPLETLDIALTDQSSGESSNKRGKKRPSSLERGIKFTDASATISMDLESSGEFASIEKMLATTNANKFSPYLQPSTVTSLKEEAERPSTSEDEKDGVDDKKLLPKPQPKGKKNAYSNSVQKMTCPFCPRVFPWASSLQRHMLTHTGQKPFPCPQCDAFFSTKSNCERHLLRKHGIASRTLRHNGTIPKPKGAEALPESAESMSDTEAAAGEALDLSAAESSKAATEVGVAQDEKPEPSAAEQHDQQEEPELNAICTGQDNHADEKDDDSLSNKSLDLNFARKLIDFKFSEAEQQQQHPAKENNAGDGTQEESKFSCPTCGKSFRYATTLARHKQAHLSDKQQEESRGENPLPADANAQQEEEEAESEPKESEGSGSGADSTSEMEEDKDKEERSDEENGATEPKSGEREAGNKGDKRKKVCSVCNKRFWSLQDLTRHMRSHTGERPYKCQTCERTFTLKHSLVRHQRIHQKPLSMAEEEAASGRSASDSESTPGGTENESERPEEEAEEEPRRSSSTQPPAEPSQEPKPDYIPELLGICTSPTREHIMPTGEPPMVGAE